MSKIGLKLSLIILAIVLCSIVIISITINSNINHQFENYLFSLNENKINRVTELLLENYENQGWHNLDQEITAFIENNGLKVYLEDNSGNILYYNHSGLLKGKISPEREVRKINLIDANNQNIGTMLWLKPLRQNLFSEHEQLFSAQIRKAIYYTAGFIGIIAIIVSIFFSGYLTTPLIKINNAAHKIARGEYRQTINIRGNDEIATLGKTFNKMAAKLNQLEEIRNESINNFAHELRTPITNINNYLEAIEDKILEPDPQTIQEIKEELQRLINLINKLRDLNEAEENIINMQKEKIDLKQLLKNVMSKYKLQADKKNISIAEKYPHNNLILKGDRDSLETIFNNLLENAIKYTNINGSIILKVFSDQEIKITLENSGTGIDQKDLPYIFERFYRADNSRNLNNDGSGIGLNIVKKLIEAHNGKIKVESNNKKTRFTICLPIIFTV
ncbi:MAG: HAMP domain-containing protein [Halanaerobiales bacterium]|nr:HAMP domain-containing protein [Halanaerobiales bacterium]